MTIKKVSLSSAKRSSASFAITGLSGTVPGQPTSVSASATGQTSATVSFTAPSNNGGSTIIAYTATSSPGGLTGSIFQAGSGTITVNGLNAGTTYTFTVVAINNIGTSSASSASNSTTTTASPAPYLLATGGTVTTSGNYKIHTFTTSGTFTVTAGASKVIEYTCIAGGGGGKTKSSAVGGPDGSGGGAGGFLTQYVGSVNGNDCIGPRFVLSSGDYITVTVGGGGNAGATGGTVGGKGGNSTLYQYDSGATLKDYLVVSGGSGGGTSYTYNNPSAQGGSGGGSANPNSYVYDIAKQGPPRQGYEGAHGLNGLSGGGGAGGAGSSSSGGPGRVDQILGSTYSAGGSVLSSATNASPNTGNGGDGVTVTSPIGGAGGSGIVIIRYQFQ